MLSNELARRALLAAEQLGFVRFNDDGRYVYSGEAELRHARRDDLSPFLGQHLLAYPPFLIFLSELTRGFPPEQAASFTVGVLDIQSKPGLALKVLRAWGVHAGLLNVDAGGVLTPTFEPADLLDFGFLKRLSDAMESNARVRTFVVDELGAEFVADLSKRGLGNLPIALADALVSHVSDPRRIGDPVGSLIETYGTALLKTPIQANSLPEIARQLERQDVILTAHRNLLIGLAGFRHAASHGVDQKTGKPWTMTPRGSLVGQLLALVTLRSLFLWMKAARQEI
jgi:hypothetical protein